MGLSQATRSGMTPRISGHARSRTPNSHVVPRLLCRGVSPNRRCRSRNKWVFKKVDLRRCKTKRVAVDNDANESLLIYEFKNRAETGGQGNRFEMNAMAIFQQQCKQALSEGCSPDAQISKQGRGSNTACEVDWGGKEQSRRLKLCSQETTHTRQHDRERERWEFDQPRQLR